MIFVRLLAPLHTVQSKPSFNRVLLLLIYLERVSLQYIQPLARKNEKTTKSAGDHLCFNIILNILAIEWFRKKKYDSYEMVKEMFMFKMFKDHKQEISLKELLSKLLMHVSQYKYKD